MPRTIRVAVLECDTPIPPVVAKFGGYGDIFERLLKGAVEANGDPEVSVEISKWHVVDNPVYPNPNEVDAFLLSGSSTSPAVVEIDDG